MRGTLSIPSVRHLRPPVLGIVAATLLLALPIAPVRAQTITIGPKVVCQTIQCIQNLTVTPQDTYATFTFTTSFAQIAEVQASTQPPQQLASGEYSFGNLPNSFAITPVVTQHTVQVQDLEPNTTYHYLITVAKGSKTAVGGDAQRMGTFKTGIAIDGGINGNPVSSG
jgi:hypothetical protein